MADDVLVDSHATEASARFEPSPYENKNVRCIMIFNFCDGACSSMWNALLLPLILGQDGRSTQLGICTSISGVAQISGACSAAWLASYYSRQRIIRIAAVIGMTSVSALMLVLLKMGIRMSSWSTLSFWLCFSAIEVLWGLYSGLSSTSTETLFADSVSSGKRTAVYNTKWIVQTMCYIVGYSFALVMLIRNGNQWSDSSIASAMYVGLSCHLVTFTLLFRLRDAYAVPGDDGLTEARDGVTYTTVTCSEDRKHNHCQQQQQRQQQQGGTDLEESMTIVVVNDCIDGVQDSSTPAVSASATTTTATSTAADTAQMYRDSSWARRAQQATESASFLYTAASSWGEVCGSASSNSDAHRLVHPLGAGNNRNSELPAKAQDCVTHTTTTDAWTLDLYEPSKHSVMHVHEDDMHRHALHPASQKSRLHDSLSAHEDLLCHDEDKGDRREDEKEGDDEGPLAVPSSSSGYRERDTAHSLLYTPEEDHIIPVEEMIHEPHGAGRLAACIVLCIARIFSWPAVPYLVCGSDLIIAIGSGATVQYFTLFFVEMCQFTPSMLYIMYILSTCTSAAISSVVRRVAERYTGRMPSVIVVRLTGAVAQLLLSQLSPRHALVVAGVFIVRNSCMNATTGISRSVIMDAVPRASRARWSAFESVCTLTWAGSAAMGGYLVALHGYQYAFRYTAFMHFIAILILVPAAFGARRVECDIHQQSSSSS